MNVRIQESEVFKALALFDHSGLPKYQRLINAMIEAIRLGVWQPGDRLPAEEELAVLSSYSLGTVQRSLRDLAAQGLVIRQHGLGSFVADHAHRLEDPWHCRFVADNLEDTVPIYSNAISCREQTRAGPWNAFLGLDQDSVMEIDRVINVNEEFNVYSRFYASKTLLRALWETPLSNLHGANFKKKIANECKLPITNIIHDVRLGLFEEDVNQIIGVSKGTSCTFLRAIAQAGAKFNVYYQEFFIPPTSRMLRLLENTSHVALR